MIFLLDNYDSFTFNLVQRIGEIDPGIQMRVERNDQVTLQQIEDAAREALARDRSGAIVLGCAGMAPLCATLSQRLGVPVIDGVAVAVKFAEALVGLGLRTSKHGDYAPPLPKPYVGWASDLRW